MKPVLLCSVSLWTLLVFCAALEISRADRVAPQAVRNLTTTNVTTSSISLKWTEPEGNSSFYRVRWTGGYVNKTNATSMMITGLTPGVKFSINVTAVAEDGFTEGEKASVTLYTRPGEIGEPSVSTNTSSISLNWTSPPGEVFKYRLDWHNGGVLMTVYTNSPFAVLSGLIPGSGYNISVIAIAGDNETEGTPHTFTSVTKPEVVSNLSFTEITTSSISLKWTKPEGNSSFYRVQWTDGNVTGSDNVTQTNITITKLTAGVQYEITVTAVTDDGSTDGQGTTVSQYTRPAVVENLTVGGITTSSISLKWTKPEGSSSFYRVQWTDGTTNRSVSVSETKVNITELTAGVLYNLTVTAVAGDNKTESEVSEIVHHTRPGQIGEPSVSTNTSSISLNWTSPLGEVFKYRLDWHNGGVLMTVYTNSPFAVLSGLIPGSGYNISVIAIAGDNKTEGNPHRFTSVTKPSVVRNLSISDVTTSSMFLNWTKPDGNATYYTVQWTLRNDTFSNTTTETYFTINNLDPGVQYNITVTAASVHSSNKGEEILKRSFTRPEQPADIMVTAQETNYLNISWHLPRGKVDHYVVNISNDGHIDLYSNTTAVTTARFTDLNPGRLFYITVTAVAGSFTNTSNESSFATKPTPPGSIIISQRTYSLILNWATPALMEGAPHISYIITYKPEVGKEQNISTLVNTTELSSLLSGTSYNITVETVGPQRLRSTAVRDSAFTLPNPVLNLAASPKSNTSIRVEWSAPLEAKLYYKYLVQTYSAAQLFNTTVSNNSTDVTHLEPGTRYNINVTTIAAKGSESSVVQTFSYTMPNPVAVLRAVDVNTTSIRLTWLRRTDHKPSYSYLVIALMDAMVVQNKSTEMENYTFYLLTPGTLYTFEVFSVVEGVKSAVESTQSYTKPYSVTMLRQTEITTNAVTLKWEQLESKSPYSYLVKTTNGSFSQPDVTVFNQNVTITGLLSGSNYSFTVTTQTQGGTKAAPVTVSYFTRPYSIRQLEFETLNTTAVRLVWTKPLEYKSEYTYRVQTTDCGSKNQTLAVEVTEMSELTPGTNCTFCVFVRAADGIEGKASCGSQYTKPEAVHPNISSLGSNSSIKVSWNQPPGHVEHYKVNLKSTEYRVPNTSTEFWFRNLSAGRLYTAVVTTWSGPFNVSSGNITNATYPNPPGPFDVVATTTSSIDVSWKEAPLMTGATFHYLLTNSSPQGEANIMTTNTSHSFTSLLSGTSYNISVATVGAMGFRSETVQTNITTRPLSVEQLQTASTEENITVKWNKPAEYKESYRYNLTWYSTDVPIGDRLIEENNLNIDKLDPGKPYNISVTTETCDETKGDPRWISTCTNASPAKNLECTGPNTTNAQVILTCNIPNGQYSGFKVTVKDGEINTTHTCNHTVSNLRHYTDYTLTVETQSCGTPSTPNTLHCRTGITNPPIPENYASLVAVSNIKYNKFTIQIQTSFLNSINGPITHIGVLVTDALHGNNSNSRNYVGTTHQQWLEKVTPGYMATVVENLFQSRSGASDLSIEIGDNSKWKGYTNGALEANGIYKYAIVLFTSLDLENDRVNSQISLISITNFLPAVTLPQNPAIIGLAVGVTLGIFSILLIILIGFVIYWKRVSNKDSPDIQIHSIRAKVSAAVRVEDYEAYYKKQKADSNCGFAEEFEDLKPVGTALMKTSAQTLENKPKNRYNNVLPYDSSRVKLSIIHGSPYDDYINANYMPGYNSRKEYIAAQGPLPTTVADFWRMIWEKNIHTVVMLTRCNEQGRVKCEQYWDHGTKHFENITVTTTSEIPLEDWTIRDFEIKNVKTAETRSVRHFHFTAWPDHGVPQSTELLISFRHLVREHMDQYSRNSPAVIHCSAGVGRTGTFIAIDHLIFQIERENVVDLYGIVHNLRMHRTLMVQTEDQYVFLNQCAMDIIRSRTGTNVDLIYQNSAAFSIYENIETETGLHRSGYYNA